MRQLYTYFRSSASYRVRIALHLKGLAFDSIPVHLLRNGGEQHGKDYRHISPAQLVPTFVDDGLTLGQSSAILEYLEEAYPSPALLPADLSTRGQVRAVVQTIACDIHPLNNLRVLQYLENTLHQDDAARADWYRHWITLGFEALEAQLATTAGQFCFGDTPTLADCCLIPQVANSRRFDTPLDRFPTLVRIDTLCRSLPAFIAAAPENQADAA